MVARLLIPLLFVISCSTCPQWEDPEWDSGWSGFCFYHLQQWAFEVEECMDHMQSVVTENPIPKEKTEPEDFLYQRIWKDCYQKLANGEKSLPEMEIELKEKEKTLREQYNCAP